MQQIKTFSDTRFESMCSYCGDWSDTGDHVPSKILLDDPFPENLPKVPCCKKCNQGFSLDEEYFACLIECVIRGSTDPNLLRREKVAKILTRKDQLKQAIASSIQIVDGNLTASIDPVRIKNVILKLARGHVRFENSEPQLDEPIEYFVSPLHLLTNQQTNDFFSTDTIEKWPEVGSRGMQRILLYNNQPISDWIEVQENIYQYRVGVSSGRTSVKILIHEYLVAEVVWD